VSASVEIKAVRPWHEALLEFVIANPRASGAETAQHFQVTEAWLSTVKNSDAFQELWAVRRGEHFSRVSSSLVEKVNALAEITVDALTDRIETEKNMGSVSIAALTEVGEMALKSLGFGAKSHAPINYGPVVNNNVFIDKETLARAREARAKMQEVLPSSSSSSEGVVRTIEHNSTTALGENLERKLQGDKYE